MTEITLPWPAKELSPNARVHFQVKAKAAKAYRETAYWLTKHSGMRAPADGWLTIRLDFHPPDRRRRDLDNMLSSAKSLLDGLADALKVNDERFALYLHRQEPCKPGKVVVSLVEIQ